MKWQNELTDLLQIDYPLVQAPMLGVSTPAMAAAIANEGGLGSLAVGGLSPEVTRALIRQTRALTSRPFAVNLFVHAVAPAARQEADRMQEFLLELGKRHGLSFEPPSPDAFQFYSYKEQIAILIEEKIPIVSFTFGIPDADSIKALQDNRIILIGTATSVKEALLLDRQRIDLITAQGIEAGGHRGSFLDNEPLPMVGTMSLVPQIVSHVDRPILAAGGIYDGGTRKAAHLLGAKAVQIGSAFLASEESMAIPSYKAAVQRSEATDSVLTRSFSGRWARGLRNRFITEVEGSGLPIPPYPLQNSLTTALRARARQQDNKEFINLWAGQSASMAEAKPSAAIFRAILQ